MSKPRSTFRRASGLIGLAVMAMLLLAACSSSNQSSQSGGNVPATGGTATQPAAMSTGTSVVATSTTGAMGTTPSPAATAGTITGTTTSPNTSATSAPTAGATGAAIVPPSQITLQVKNDAKLGNFLTDDKGMTLYTFAKDTPGKSNCTGQCLANWPALEVAQGGHVTVTGGDQSQVGMITRPDGATQVTYRNMPLYYFIKDKNPGDTNGQGVGSVWYVAKP